MPGGLRRTRVHHLAEPIHGSYGGVVRRVAVVAAVGLVIGALIVVGWTTSLDVITMAIVSFLETLQSAGLAAWVGFVLLWGVIALTGLPVSWMQLTSGFLLGPVWGYALAFVLSNAWGFVGFVLARTVLRDRAQRFVERTPVFSAMDAAVRERGAWMVLLLRVSPLAPYNVVNLALGTTMVSIRDYVMGSMVGALLPMALYVGVGASVSDLAAVWSGEVAAPGWARSLGLIVTAVATILVTWRVRRQLVAAGVA